MLKSNRPFLLAFLLTLAAGCGSDSSNDGSTDLPPEPLTTLALGEYSELLQASWTVGSGEEKYVCARRTLGEDLYVDGFDALSPSGTHHTVLTVGPPTGPDGFRDCGSPSEGHELTIHATGIGTDPVEFPEGVAAKLRAGWQLHLNIHLFNTSAAPLSGLSGTLGRGADPTEIVHEAEAVLMGTEEIRIGARETRTLSGVCTQRQSSTLFAMFPHMHQIGTHMRVVAQSASGDVTVHDQAYNFDDQRFTVFPASVDLTPGDRVTVDCTYDNTTDSPVRFGESSNDEMCYAVMFRYPASADPVLSCTD